MRRTLLLLMIASSSVLAEPVYKCTSDSGKVLYSNEPCVGAERIDATGSRGFNKSSGKVMKGLSVQKEEADEMAEKVMRPLYGQSWSIEKNRKRQFMPLSERARCERLDYDIERLERLEKTNKGRPPELRDVQVELFQKRKAFREIDC